MARKRKGLRLTEKLMTVNDRTWRLICLLAVMTMLFPLVLDFVIPEKKYDSSTADPSDLVIIRDYADLLTDEEEKALSGHMLPVTKYGGAAFYTNSSSISNASSYAKRCYRECFGTKSGTLFLIDMYTREIYIFSDGRIYSKITNAKAKTITDNVYRYATRGDYAGCAMQVFDQISTLLAGGIIPQYMKHASNALLSFAIGLLAVFIVANAKTRMQDDNEAKVFQEMARKKAGLGSPTEQNLVKIKRTRHTESSGGGGGGGGSSGGGGGGGGSSGGGGGHGF
jgi:uncharacterized protein